MLNLGFGSCKMYVDKNEETLPMVPVKQSIENEVSCRYEQDFHYLDTQGQDLTQVEKKIKLKKEVTAPVEKGDVAGSAHYYLNGEEIGTVRLLFADSVEKSGYKAWLKEAASAWLL